MSENAVGINMRLVSHMRHDKKSGKYAFYMSNGHTITATHINEVGKYLLESSESRIGCDYVLLCESRVIDATIIDHDEFF